MATTPGQKRIASEPCSGWAGTPGTSLVLLVRRVRCRASRHGRGLTRPAVTQEEGRCILLLREQARKVDFVCLTVILYWDLEVGYGIDALLVLVPGLLVRLASEN